MKEIIYLNFPTTEIEKLYPEYTDFYFDFKAKTEQFHTVEKLCLPDVWLRDFLPVQNLKNKRLFNLFYDPTYKRSSLKNFYLKIRNEVKKEFSAAQDLPIRMDGGNLIFNRHGQAFAFEKTTIKKNSSYEELSNILKEALSLKELTWLPRLPESHDPFCHIDGFMQFLGDDTLLMNEPYDTVTEKHFNKCLEIIKAVMPDLRIIKLPIKIDPQNTLSAKGLYVNFLETSKVIFVPQYNLLEDRVALAIICAATNKTVIGINCEGISKYGGSLHCLTSTQIGSF
jgi:agmatine/peptidylarginine deiminase